MKISVNWMLDHIATPISTLDVGLIVAKFNTRTAEIEHYEKFELEVQNLFIVQVQSYDIAECITWCQELDMMITLPVRNDILAGQLFLVRRHDQIFNWEQLQKYSIHKEGFFPAIDCDPVLLSGEWKKYVEDVDYILEVDNKSINHRPDLWGHRGIAREVAAFMDWQLKPLESMLAVVDCIYKDQAYDDKKHDNVSILLDNISITPRLAAWHSHAIEYKASNIFMAMRLARIESKPLNAIVDCTNYVMFDISQPIHVFDADIIKNKRLIARTAHNHESLQLLDGVTIALTEQDIIIADEDKPLALAGVMGGKASSFSPTTSSIIIESGSFHASMVRNSATRIKHITQASTRFAKQLDPMQNTTALLRFIALGLQIGVIGTVDKSMVSVGKIYHDTTLTIEHAFIEKRLGIKISVDRVIELLSSVSFDVRLTKHEDDTIYHVVVPTYRGTKDITIPEDIVEEIARLYGFENIAYQRPDKIMKSFDISVVEKIKQIKQYCAFSMNMHEVKDYLFYDESFLKRLSWYPKDAVAIKNPVSENWKVLVTSLIPHLIKNVELNSHMHAHINLFEHNNIWKEISPTQSVERKALSGIFFGNDAQDFYDYKAQLVKLFVALQLPVVWIKSQENIEPWFDRYQTADLVIQGVKIGRAGMLSTAFVKNVVEGKGFVFELSSDLIVSYPVAEKQFTPWSKYQTVDVDISMLIDASQTSDMIIDTIKLVDALIINVVLVDFFEKESWGHQRSLTMRYTIADFTQTLSKDSIDHISQKVKDSIIHLGGQIR